jgi:RimJ/RimL family protein N-acetyltransferase
MRGPNVALRPLRDEDSASLFEWINDRELVLLNAPFKPVAEAEHARWFEEIRKRPDVAIFGIRVNEGDRLIGSCQLLGLDSIHGVAELQIRIGAPDGRGRGLGTEAVRLLVQHAFGELGLRRVQLHAFDDNAPALRCYQKVGFVREGLLREGALIEGRPKDLVVMGILAGELR